MPDATKRILTDETGQDIVSALETLCTLVDPNGTAVAAAEKINNMTISVSGIAAGSSPTASVSEVDGHKHIALGIPVELPVVSSQDNGKVMMVKNGAWDSDIMDNATSETAGLMSAEDKQKLDGIEEIEIYQEIESNSNSVSFSDGAEAPLEELVIDIEPKQDLHGYSRPWVGGAGKNLFDIGTVIYNKYINQNGVETDSTNGGMCSQLIPVTAGETYTASWIYGSSNAWSFRVHGYNSSGVWQSPEIANKANTSASSNVISLTFTIPTGVAYIRISFNNSFSDVQVEKGSTATTWEPYANICPISGYDTVNISWFGKNMMTPVETGAMDQNTGAEVVSNDARRTAFIPVDGIKTLTISGLNGEILSNKVRFFEYDAEKNFLNQTLSGTVSSSGIITFATTRNDTKYIRLQSDKTIYYGTSQVQLEYGATPTKYETPLQTVPIAVSLATNGNQTAGTVYSGTVTLLADGSGQVVVDHKYVEFDGSSDESWTWQSDNSRAYIVAVSGIKGAANTRLEIKSNFGHFPGDNDEIDGIFGHSSGRIYYYPLSSITSAAELKTFLAANNLQIVYELATPVAYTLTANQIQTLLGYNYIYTDGTTISLKYPRNGANLISAADKIKIDSLATVASTGNYNDLINKPDLSNYLTSVPTMTGATSSAAGAAGLVPAPATTDVDKFLSGDGTYKSGGLPMVILSYGNSTWNDFITAYHNNVIVYCRASSNANPASGKQTRMAFMAYVNDADAPTQVEFQYYRSMNPTNKSISQMSDQVFVYTLSSNGSWSVISREASIKSIVFDASSGLTGTYDKNTGTLTITAAT